MTDTSSGGMSWARRPGRFVFWLALCVLGMGLSARLGVWQLDRAQRKAEWAAQIGQRQTQAVLTQDRLVAALGEELHYRRVRIKGRWVAEATVFLDNRNRGSQAGFVVLTPLRLAGQTGVVMVQRGWVARDLRDRTRLPPIQTETEDIELEGVLAPPPSQLYAFEVNERGVIRQNIDFKAFAEETGLAILPWSVWQTGPEQAQFQREWPQAVVDVSKHHGYAFQWFALCALIGLLYVWFQLIAPRRKKH